MTSLSFLGSHFLVFVHSCMPACMLGLGLCIHLSRSWTLRDRHHCSIDSFQKMIAGFSYLVGYIPWTHPSSYPFLRGYSCFTFIRILSHYVFFLDHSTMPLSSLLPPLLPLSSWTYHQKVQNPSGTDLTFTITINVKRILTCLPLFPRDLSRVSQIVVIFFQPMVSRKSGSALLILIMSLCEVRTLGPVSNHQKNLGQALLRCLKVSLGL